MPTDEGARQYPSVFTKTLAFVGVFEVGGLQSPQVSIEVTYSTINSHPPRGIIRGTSAEYEALQRFFISRRSPVCTLRSAAAERGITCHEVLTHSIGERRFAKDEQAAVHQVMGRFSIGRLELRHHFTAKTDTVKRRAVFYLTGPSKFWLTTAIPILSWSGEARVEVHDDILTLDIATPDTVSARPHYVYAESQTTGADHRQSIQAELFALTIDDGQRDEGKQAAFPDRATALVESLCLLVGFLSKARITWFASLVSSPALLIETFTDAKTVDAEAPSWEDVPIYADDIRPFLNVALAAYTTSDIELRLPILHYISAQSSRFVEDGFTVLFFALEKLLSSLDERKPDELLADKELSNLWKVVRAALEDMKKTPEQMELILQKRGELQRPPLKHRISRHLGDLSIDISDIGGDAGLARMYRVRNRLTHAHGEVPIEEIMVETRRLETIVERMLLKLLKWEGKSRTPTRGNWPIEEDERKPQS